MHDFKLTTSWYEAVTFDVIVFSLDSKTVQWFLTFLSLRLPNFENKFGGTKRLEWIKIWRFFAYFNGNFKTHLAHLEKIDGTLVRRGTPVENPWFNIF